VAERVWLGELEQDQRSKSQRIREKIVKIHANRDVTGVRWVGRGARICEDGSVVWSTMSRLERSAK
jgi:hypothetical protein